MKRPFIEPKNRIILPIDMFDPAKALLIIKDLKEWVGGFKFGLAYLHAMRTYLLKGTEEQAIANLRLYREAFSLTGEGEFTDAKLCDIPETVAQASATISALGVRMFNVHASAGPEAIAKAVQNAGRSSVLGVTVLTSLDADDCKSIFGDEPGRKVLQFADWLVNEGAHGVICSPLEAELLRQDAKFDVLEIISPGIRPEWMPKGDDQKRTMTPSEAIRAGVDRLVIGRPIRVPPPQIGTSVKAAQTIVEEVAQALREMA